MFKKTIERFKSPLFRAVLFLCTGLIFMTVSGSYKGFFKYILMGFYCLFYILALIDLFRYIGIKLKTSIKQIFLNLVNKIIYIYKNLSEKAADFFKKSDKITYLKGSSDQKRYIVDLDEFNIFKKLINFSKRKRWKDLKTNRERIRFIYLRYIAKAVKHGYHLNEAFTPNEVYVDLSAKNEKIPTELFVLYNTAHYGSDNAVISDDEVSRTLETAK